MLERFGNSNFLSRHVMITLLTQISRCHFPLLPLIVSHLKYNYIFMRIVLEANQFEIFGFLRGANIMEVWNITKWSSGLTIRNGRSTYIGMEGVRIYYFHKFIWEILWEKHFSRHIHYIYVEGINDRLFNCILAYALNNELLVSIKVDYIYVLSGALNSTHRGNWWLVT